MIIGEKTLKVAGDLLTRQMIEYAKDIDKGYCLENNLTVALSVKFSPDAAGVKIDTGIAFVTERIKDRATTTVYEKQMELFGKGIEDNGHEIYVKGSATV